MNREGERLIQRATPLVFGIFGQAERGPDQREVRFGGGKDSHCRFQTLTARYMNRDLLRVNPSVAGLMIVRMWRLCGRCAWWTMSIPTWVV